MSDIALERELQLLRAELAERETLCRVGEAADVVVHELSNVLNAILLQTAVIQQKAADPLRSQLAVIRDQGRLAVDQLGQLHRYRRDSRPPPISVDLHRVIRQAVTAGPPRGPAVNLNLTPSLPTVLGTLSDLKLLATLLVKHAVAVTPLGGTVWIRTTQKGDIVEFHVQDGGPLLDPETLEKLFDPTAPNRDGAIPLELAICQTLVRRLNGSLRAEARADGVTLLVELKAAQ